MSKEIVSRAAGGRNSEVARLMPGEGQAPRKPRGDGWDHIPMARPASKTSTSPLKKSLRDMLLSMAVISLPIVAIVEWFPHDSKKPEDAVQTVDYTIPLDQARRDPDLPFKALAPETLPAGWRATSIHADLQPGSQLRWELGFLTSDQQYAALDQVAGGKGVDGVLAVQAPDATQVSGAGGPVTAGGYPWQVYVPGRQRHALVRTTAPVGAAAATRRGGSGRRVGPGRCGIEDARGVSCSRRAASARAAWPRGSWWRGSSALLAVPRSRRRSPRPAGPAPRRVSTGSAGQRLAAFPRRQGLLQRQPAGLQTADDVHQLVPGLLVAEVGEVGVSPGWGSSRSPWVQDSFRL